MTTSTKKEIRIPGVTRIEGHAAVHVEISDGQVSDVRMEVTEGPRFFEKMLVGHQFNEMPHLTSRICAICSAGHVLSAIHAVERSTGINVSETTRLFRVLMQLGMFIESHATHIYALALPDFVGAVDVDLATRFEAKFIEWTKLRNLGAAIQTTVGGRPFHPVNLHVGGLGRYPAHAELDPLLAGLKEHRQIAIDLCELLVTLAPPVKLVTKPVYLALIPQGDKYGYMGDRVKCSEGWEDSIENYREFLNERVMSYSHAKQSSAKGKPHFVGSMARLVMFWERLGNTAKSLWQKSPMANGADTNIVWNNLGQAIELVDAIEQSMEIIETLKKSQYMIDTHDPRKMTFKAGEASGASEVPRGTLYHRYNIDSYGKILAADIITPTAQNTARMEVDIKEVVATAKDPTAPEVVNHLETVLRAYDPCNTCATHMVQVTYK